MNAKLTDDAVADLPLHLGRAELLEEIMSTPVITDRPVRTEPPRRRTTWVVPVAAAAAVLALVAASAWLVGSRGPGAGDSAGDRGTGVAAAPAPGAYRAVLDAPGWTVDNVYAERDSGELSYSRGDRSFEITWYAADAYDSYVEDRRHIVEPPADGEPIQVLGLGAQLWAYNATDHAAIREVDDGHWLELRGQGMSKAAYLSLLTQLRLVDQPGFESAMPGSFIDGSERTAAVDEILDGIGDFASPLLPSGVARSSITADQNDPYQLGVEVAGAVACAWLDEYADATRTGADRRAQRAAGILTTTQDWPVLKQMDARGDYPEVLWGLADQVAAGQLPDWYADGLGCDR